MHQGIHAAVGGLFLQNAGKVVRIATRMEGEQGKSHDTRGNGEKADAAAGIRRARRCDGIGRCSGTHGSPSDWPSWRT